MIRVDGELIFDGQEATYHKETLVSEVGQRI